MSNKNEAMVSIIKQLIAEVKTENKGKLLSEGLVTEQQAVAVEKKALKQYVTKNLVEALKAAEK